MSAPNTQRTIQGNLKVLNDHLLRKGNVIVKRVKIPCIKGFNVVNSKFEAKPALAYVGGALGQNNLGDEALFSSAKFLFKKYNLIHYDGCRTRKSLLYLYPFIKNGVLAGGTLINQHEIWLKNASEFLGICKNLYIFGTGVANKSFWSSKKEWHNSMDNWKKVLEKCNRIGVIGPISAELLNDAGIKDVKVVGDPVLVFAKEEINIIRPLLLSFDPLPKNLICTLWRAQS